MDARGYYMDGGIKGLALAPPPYFDAIAGYLKKHEPEAWKWFSEDIGGGEHIERVRLELLKRAYRIDRESKADVYALADVARERLSLTAPVTFYQLQQAPGGMNVSLFHIPGEAHVAFSGPVLERVDRKELSALVGHELGHFRLFEDWGRRFRVAAELLTALVHDQEVRPAHMKSYRLFQLYSEVFCDRCSLVASEDLHASISGLVKVETGIDEVSAESYLRQTDEILSKGQVKTEGASHPECYIRARALKLWSDGAEDVDARVRDAIEGPPSLDGLDLLGQTRTMAMTRRLIDELLREPWMQSDAVMSHARLFFDNFAPPKSKQSDDGLDDLAAIEDEKLADYLCYVMLDFVSCDRDLEEPALAGAHLLSRRLGLAKSFRKIACKELKLRKRQFDKLEADAEDILRSARDSGGQS